MLKKVMQLLYKHIVLSIVVPVVIVAGAITVTHIYHANNNHVQSTVNRKSDDELAAERKKEHMALITIDDKAGLADTNYRVNGLHVYDYTTKDKEDYVDGAEVPYGTHLSIFVYNLASEEHLKVTHNGKVIVDKDYPILKSDKDVEKIKFKVEGDVKVETWVVNSKAKNHIGTIRINNDELATAYVGNKELQTFDDIHFGTYDITVKAKHNGVKAILKINDRRIGTADILGNQTYTFKNVKVDGDVYFIYRPLNKKEVEKLGGTFNPNDTTNRVRAGQVVAGAQANDSDPIVTIINRVANDSRITLDVRHVDTDHNIYDIVSGNHYPRDMFVFSRVINRSDLRLRLTAILNGRVYKSVIINPKPANDDATYFGIREIVLSDNLTYVLEVDQESGSTYHPSPAPEPSPSPSPSPSPAPVVPTPTPHPTPSIPRQTYKLTIHNGASVADQRTCFNNLHVYNPVYNPVTDDYDEYENNATIKKGDKIVVYPYNNVTDIHLKIVHNGKVIVDRDCDVFPAQNAEAERKLIYYHIDVEGDVEVTTTVGKTGRNFVDLYYPVTIKNSNLAKIYVDNQPIGDKVLAELHELKVTVGNEPIELTVRLGKKYRFIKKVRLEANKTYVFQNFPAKNVINIEMNSLALSPSKQYKVEVNNPYSDVETKISNINGTDVKPVVSGQKYDENTKIYTQIINRSNAELIVTATKDGQVVEEKTIPVSNDPNGLNPIVLSGDLKIEVKKKEVVPPAKQYKVEINNPYSQLQLNIFNIGKGEPKKVVSGQKYDENTKVMAQIINKSQDEYTVTATMNGKTVETKTILVSNDPSGLNPIVLSGDLKIEVKKKEVLPRGTYKLTIDDQAAKANKPGIVNGLHVFNPDTEDLDEYNNNDLLKKDNKVYIYTSNYATDIHLKVVYNGKIIVDRDIKRIEPIVDDDNVIWYRLNKIEGNIEVTTTVGTTGKNYVDFNYPVTVSDSSLAKIYDGDKPLAKQLSADWHDLKVESLNEPITVAIKCGKRVIVRHKLDAHSAYTFKRVPVKNDMYIEIAKQPKKYKLELVNPYNDVEVHFLDADLDDDPNELDANDVYEEETPIFTQITNKSNAELIVTATKNGKQVLSKTLAVSSDPVMLDAINLTGDLKFEIKKKEVVPPVKQYKVEINNPYSQLQLNIFNIGKGEPKKVVSGQKYDENTKVMAQIINKSQDEYTVTATMNGKTVETKTIPVSNDPNGLNPIVLSGDLKIEVKKKEVVPPVKQYKVEINNPYSQLQLNIFNIGKGEPKKVVSGQKYDENTKVMAQIINKSQDEYTVTATMNGKTVETKTIPVSSDPSGLDPIVLSGDLKIEVKKKEKVPHKYKLTINNGASSADKRTRFNNVHVYNPVYNPVTDDYDEYENNAELKKGDKIVIYPYNNASDMHLKIVHNGKLIVDRDCDVFPQQNVEAERKIIYYRFDIEGDVEITTTAGKTGKNFVDFYYPVTIKNGNLAKIYADDKPLGDKLLAELHELKIEVGNKPIELTIKLGKKYKYAKKVKLEANQTYLFKDFPAKNSVNIEMDSVAPKPAKQYKVEINNPYSQLQLNIFNIGKGEPKKVVSGQKYDENTKVMAQIINKSQDEYTVTATMNGKAVETKTIPVSNDPNGLNPIVLSGDLKIEIKKKEVLPPIVKKHKVEIINPYSDVEVSSFCTGKPLPVVSGEQIKENSQIFTRIINKSNSELTVTATMNGKAVETKTIPVSNDPNGLNPIVLSGDLKIEIKKKEVVPPIVKKHKVEIINPYSDVEISSFCTGKPLPVVSGEQIKENSQIFTRIINKSTSELTVTATMNGKAVETKTMPVSNDPSGLDPIVLSGDLKIEVKKRLDVINKYNDVQLKVQRFAQNSAMIGERSVQLYTIVVDITNKSVDTVKVYVKNTDGTVLGSKEVSKAINNRGNKDELRVENVAGDVVVSTEKLFDPAIQKYTVDIDNQLAGNNLIECDIRYTVKYEPIDIIPGQQLYAGQKIYVRIRNRSDKRLKISAMAHGKVIRSGIVEPKPDDDDATYYAFADENRVPKPIVLSSDIKFVLEEVK